MYAIFSPQRTWNIYWTKRVKHVLWSGSGAWMAKGSISGGDGGERAFRISHLLFSKHFSSARYIMLLLLYYYKQAYKFQLFSKDQCMRSFCCSLANGIYYANQEINFIPR